MREKKLLLNSILYFFGSLGKGVASTLLVLIASFFISPSDMGTYDLIVSTIVLLQPIIIMQLNDGIYRWLLETPSERETVIGSGITLACQNMLIADLLIIPAAARFRLEHWPLAVILLNLNCLYPLAQQITRGLKNHRIFAVSGILHAALMLSLAYGFLRCGGGVRSLYVAQIAANSVVIAYLAKRQNVSLLPARARYRRGYAFPMLKYSIMLVPNSVNVWIMKALDKYCIFYFFSSFENGIYTVAHRFPDVFTMLNNMFYSAWVEQSIVEYGSEDRDAYFSKIYNAYSGVMFCAALILIPAVKYMIFLFAGEAYRDAWRYASVLCLAVVFSGLSSFLGTGYLGSLHTEGIMWTSLAGSAVNTLMNLLFMPRFGLQVAGVSSLCAYFFMWLARLWHTRSFFRIKVDWPSFSLLFAVALAFCVLIQCDAVWLDIALEALALSLTVLFHRARIAAGLRLTLKRIRKRGE